MADSISIEIKGLQALKDAFTRVGPKVERRAATTGTRQPAKRLRRELRKAAPRRTGDLARAIRYRKIRYRRGSALVGYKVRVHRSQAHIARFLEYGTQRMRPHPWFWKTYERLERRLAGDLIEGMADAVDLEAGKEFARQRRRAR